VSALSIRHMKARTRATTGWTRPGVVAALDDRPLLMVWIGVVLFSVGPVMVAGSTTSGGVLSFWRLWIGAVLLGALTAWRRRTSGIRVSLRGWGWAAAAGLAFGIHQLFFMIAVKATSVVDVALMQLLQPVLVGVLAFLAFGERFGVAFRLWSLVAVAGGAIVILAGTTGPEGNPLGMVLAVANIVFYALYFVWSKQAMTHMGALPFLLGVAVFAGLAASVFVAVTGAPVFSIGTRDLLIAAGIAVIPGSLGHFVTTHSLARVPANVPPVLQLAIPFLSGGLAWLLLGQGFSLMHVVGGLVTLVGVVGALVSPAGRRTAGGGSRDRSRPAERSATAARPDQRPVHP
jgi:drug/metabolite transporter (DMT)-like permease